MKRLLTIFLLIACINSAWAQWTGQSSSTDLTTTIYRTGNVGIGTSTPAFNLDVAGTIRSNAYFRITNVGTGNQGIFADDAWGSTVFSISRNANNETRFQSFGFHTFFNGGSTGVERMRIDANGHVGIGTTAPNEKLTVNGSVQIPLTAAVGFIPSTDKFTHNGNFIGNYSMGWSNDTWQTGAPTAYFSGYGGIKFFTNTTARLAINYDGNVGIGTTTPNARLEILQSLVEQPAIKVSNFQIVPQLLNGSWNGISKSGDTGIILLNGKSLVIAPHQSSVSGLRMTADGNVGIGTADPDAKLAVKGTIHTQEVRVDLNGAVAPDYVFEKDYDLMPLDELKVYLEANKHLPEVPSAKEMDAHGVNLKEMNLLLLKKVEELTLYIIEQEKRIIRLESKK